MTTEELLKLNNRICEMLDNKPRAIQNSKDYDIVKDSSKNTIELTFTHPYSKYKFFPNVYVGYAQTYWREVFDILAASNAKPLVSFVQHIYDGNRCNGGGAYLIAHHLLISVNNVERYKNLEIEVHNLWDRCWNDAQLDTAYHSSRSVF